MEFIMEMRFEKQIKTEEQIRKESETNLQGYIFMAHQENKSLIVTENNKDIIEAYDIEDLRLKELEEFRSKRLKNENLIYII